MINEKSFDKLVQGKQVGLYTIESATGLKAQITNYGAKIVTLFVPQADGTLVDVVLGFSTLDEWLAQEDYFNGINGRVAGRISYAQAEVDGQLYHLRKIVASIPCMVVRMVSTTRCGMCRKLLLIPSRCTTSLQTARKASLAICMW